MSHETEYRIAVLPGFGTVRVPAHLTDNDVLAQITGADADADVGADQSATPRKKTKKKP